MIISDWTAARSSSCSATSRTKRARCACLTSSARPISGRTWASSTRRTRSSIWRGAWAKKPFIEALYRALGADPAQPAPKEQRVCRFALAHGFPAESVELAVRRTEAHQGHRSLDYTLGILRQWEKSGVHTISEITALEPESRTAAVAVGQTEAQPTDSGTLADWEQAWLAQRKRSDGE